ncbi:uncharacterized protein LOC121640451 [Melanotaenia boesemani]|uniref:uncharacterized protein LOC121640451 n=1 Tax=Melanotaenia boesemani TaxID=1250792 RepID=UPI001C03B366|nr:uncharacterized protein LOC121640451 [Melanotaenia boesemani]
MDVIQAENVKVPNSVLVGGLTGEEVDNEVFEYLGQIGPIEKIVKVTSSETQFKGTAIVEFKSGEPVQFLQDSLPCSRPTSNPNVFNDIRCLSDLYAANRGSTLTHAYLDELKAIAKLSGADFEKVLLDELTRIQKSTKQLQSAEPALFKADCGLQLATDTVTAETMTNPTQTPTKVVLPLPKKQAVYVPCEQLTTPEVQKVVVEHVIRSSEVISQYHSRTKLRCFSGKIPCPSMESDYDTWRSNVDFYLGDPSMSDKVIVRKIIESLLSPAALVVKHLGPNSSPHDYLSLLDSAYGTVDDGDDLFAKFLNTNQNSGEKPSSYLQRLQTALTKVVKRGGIAAIDAERQLLKQFCRGCWNNSLITSLQLEQKKDHPPSFAELLLLLHTEEDLQATKSHRMKQHLRFSKAKVQSNPISVSDCISDDANLIAAVAPPIANKLEQQIAILQAQIASLKTSLSSKPDQSAKSKQKSKSKPKALTELKSPPPVEFTPGRKPRPGY